MKLVGMNEQKNAMTNDDERLTRLAQCVSRPHSLPLHPEHAVRSFKFIGQHKIYKFEWFIIRLCAGTSRRTVALHCFWNAPFRHNWMWLDDFQYVKCLDVFSAKILSGGQFVSRSFFPPLTTVSLARGYYIFHTQQQQQQRHHQQQQQHITVFDDRRSLLLLFFQCGWLIAMQTSHSFILNASIETHCPTACSAVGRTIDGPAG